MKVKGIFFGLLLASQFAAACGFHYSADGSVAASGAFHVVWRSVTLTKSHQIEAVPELPDEQAFRRASWWLRLLTQQMQQREITASHILLADVSLWSEFDSSATTPLMIDVAVEDADNIDTNYHSSWAANADF